MRDYKMVSELVAQLETSPKAVSERLRTLGVSIVGGVQMVPGVARGGLVATTDILFSGLSSKQSQLFAQDEAAVLEGVVDG